MNGMSRFESYLSPEQLPNTAFHLFGHLLGTGRSQDLFRAVTILLDEIGEFEGDPFCLAGAGAGEDEQPTVKILAGILLLFIEVFK